MGVTSLVLLREIGGPPLSDFTTVIGSFGATAVLLYGAPAVPFSQPRNVVGGHTISAAIGSATAMGLPPSAAAPIAVSTSLMAMMVTKTVHPPAGGTALIAVVGGSHIQNMGLLFAAPACFGACVMVSTATMYHKSLGNKYPQ